MKTIKAGLFGKSFLKALLLSLLLSLLSAKNLTAMPFLDRHEPVNVSPTEDKSPAKMRANSYAAKESQLVIMQLENPSQKKVTILFLNSSGNIVYRKVLRNVDKFIGKFNLDALPNDTYTLLVESDDYRYSNSFTLKTQTTRILKVGEPNKPNRKQEFI